MPQPINSYNQIRFGTDGIILKKDGYSALFLPQVATEQRWTLAETLTHLSLKAGSAGGRLEKRRELSRLSGRSVR